MKTKQSLSYFSTICFFLQKIQFFLLFQGISGSRQNRTGINQELCVLKILSFKWKNSFFKKLIVLSVLKNLITFVKGPVILLKICNQTTYQKKYNLKTLKLINKQLYLTCLRLNNYFYGLKQIKDLRLLSYCRNLKNFWQIILTSILPFYKTCICTKFLQK